MFPSDVEVVVRSVEDVTGEYLITLTTTRSARTAASAASDTRALLLRLPRLRRLVVSDVDAAFDGDPALKIKEECRPAVV